MLPPNLYARVQHSYAQTAHETAGAARTRSSLRPRMQARANEMQDSDKSCRENADAHFSVILANAGIQYAAAHRFNH